MTKNEFMARFASELKKRNIAESDDIIGEYEQHFAFRLADGYSEEEIAARLGDPVALAAQFGESDTTQKPAGKPLVVVGLCFADLFFGLFFILLAAWELVLAAAGISFAGAAVCLFGGINAFGIIPPMPYWCGAVLALSFAALTVLTAVACIYYFAFLRQLARAYGRFRKNALAGASGGAVLPSLPIAPGFSGKAKRRLRSAALISFALFAACFALSYAACALSAGGLEFWHIWGWFSD